MFGKMFRLKCSSVSWCVSIAIWTIIQTTIHIYGIVYVIWWRDCKIKKEETSETLLYLTYFFTRKCEKETFLALSTNRQVSVSVVTENMTVDQAGVIERLDSLILAYLILDALWLIASVTLITGACCQIRQLWALPFYVPWIVMDAVILFFDAFCSVYFGLNIPSEGSFFDWLNFIGITIRFNEEELQGDMTSLVTGAASVIMMFISARGGIVWIINLILMYFVVNATIEAIKKPGEGSGGRLRRTASERIRKWNAFYGAVEKGRSRKEDKTRDDFGKKIVALKDCEDLEQQSNSVSLCPASGYDGEYSNSGDLISAQPKGLKLQTKTINERDPLTELRNQLPWTYVDQEERVEAIRPDLVPDKFYDKDTRMYEGVSKF